MQNYCKLRKEIFSYFLDLAASFHYQNSSCILQVKIMFLIFTFSLPYFSLCIACFSKIFNLSTQLTKELQNYCASYCRHLAILYSSPKERCEETDHYEPHPPNCPFNMKSLGSNVLRKSFILKHKYRQA